jgi:hypothetical protein
VKAVKKFAVRALGTRPDFVLGNRCEDFLEQDLTLELREMLPDALVNTVPVRQSSLRPSCDVKVIRPLELVLVSVP